MRAGERARYRERRGHLERPRREDAPTPTRGVCGEHPRESARAGIQQRAGECERHRERAGERERPQGE